MKRLIVSADDFGLTRSINEGIIKAYREGIVTNLNCMPAGEAFEDARGLIGSLGLRDIGAHLSLTESAAVTEPRKIPTLVTKDNRFYKDHNAFLFKFIFGLIRQDEIYLELKGQLEKVRRLGVNITNLSSHEHIHMMPSILDIFIRLAGEYNIPSIRYPCGERIRRFGAGGLYKHIIMSYFRQRTEKALEEKGIIYPEHFAGFFDSGRLTEDALSDMLTHLDDGVTELVCHPGFLGPEILSRYKWHANCEYELYALTSRRIKRIINENDIKLITYQDFLKLLPCTSRPTVKR